MLRRSYSRIFCNRILSKLDGVDWEKRRRYELVYARLYDFEQFMLARGVDPKYLADNRITLPRRTYVHVTVYQEVGHGGASSLPAGVTEDNKNDLDTKVAVLDNLSQTTYDNFIFNAEWAHSYITS